LTYKELLALVLDCANGDTQVALDAFYPEFFSGLCPGSSAFNYMVNRKREAQHMYRSIPDLEEKTRLIKERLSDEPIYGWRINMGDVGSTEFDWDKFIKAMTT